MNDQYNPPIGVKGDFIGIDGRAFRRDSIVAATFRTRIIWDVVRVHLASGAACKFVAPRNTGAVWVQEIVRAVTGLRA